MTQTIHGRLNVEGELAETGRGPLSEALVELEIKATPAANGFAPTVTMSGGPPATQHASPTPYVAVAAAFWHPNVVSDPSGLWSATTGTFTAPSTGLYLFQLPSAMFSTEKITNGCYDFVVTRCLQIDGVLYVADVLVKGPTHRTDPDIAHFSVASFLVRLTEGNAVKLLTRVAETSGSHMTVIAPTSAVPHSGKPKCLAYGTPVKDGRIVIFKVTEE